MDVNSSLKSIAGERAKRLSSNRSYASTGPLSTENYVTCVTGASGKSLAGEKVWRIRNRHIGKVAKQILLSKPVCLASQVAAAASNPLLAACN